MFSYAYHVACLLGKDAIRMFVRPRGFYVDKVLVFDESETSTNMYEYAPTYMSVKQLKEYSYWNSIGSKFVMFLTDRNSDVSSDTTMMFISPSARSWR